VRAGESATIELQLDRAMLEFEWSFEAVGDSHARLTQRIVLSGENAASYAEQVQSGFGPNLPAGMSRLAAAMASANGHGVTEA
jgi:hypothetical protein